MLSKNQKILEQGVMFNWDHSRVSYECEIVFFEFLTQINNANKEEKI